MASLNGGLGFSEEWQHSTIDHTRATYLQCVGSYDILLSHNVLNKYQTSLAVLSGCVWSNRHLICLLHTSVSWMKCLSSSRSANSGGGISFPLKVDSVSSFTTTSFSKYFGWIFTSLILAALPFLQNGVQIVRIPYAVPKMILSRLRSKALRSAELRGQYGLLSSTYLFQWYGRGRLSYL